MIVKRLFYSPKDVATIFDMTVRQVYYHAHRCSPGFPPPKLIGSGRKRTMRFSIEETDRCVKTWIEEQEENE